MPAMTDMIAETARATITARLPRIADEHGVRILLAVESGSRAWGFPSQDSDYDVRFLYLHPPAWYLMVESHRDVIEYPVDAQYDYSGWDLRKALQLFRKSNPPLMEWMSSPHIYCESSTVAAALRALLPTCFSPLRALHHYLHMAEGNYREYLKGETVRIKKYLYVLRPVFACQWIEERGTMPPMEYTQLLAAAAPVALRPVLDRLLARKMSGEELDREPRLDAVNEYIEERLAHFRAYAATLQTEVIPEATVDAVFRNALQEVWDLKLPGAGEV